MKRWEYHAHTMHVSKLPTFLDSMGQHGWELVSMAQGDGPAGMLLLVFKRERQARAAEPAEG